MNAGTLLPRPSRANLSFSDARFDDSYQGTITSLTSEVDSERTDDTETRKEDANP